MDNGSSRGSNISLTESEPRSTFYSVSSRSSNSLTSTSRRTVLGDNCTHKYNTRLSARRFVTLDNTPLKKLYVDLSTSRIDVPQNNFQVVAQIWSSSRQRRDSCSTQDSKEFDFDTPIVGGPKQLEFRDTNMYDRNPCVQRTNWLKYFVLLSLTAILYVYIQLLHNTDVIKKVHKDLDKLRFNFEESRNKLIDVEAAMITLRHEKEKFERDVPKIIEKEIEKFSSDKTGMTDFALESTGGKIVQLSPGTENFEPAVSVFGLKLCDGKHGPRAMIQADMSPGHCWAIKGSIGGVVIKLIGMVKVNAVSLEHISKNLSPTGEISSAPKTFSVWGLKTPTGRGVALGKFTYLVDGPLVQMFPVTSSNYFEYVEFRVLANQGNSDFTCIYRFRVHGSLDKSTGHG